VIDALRAEAGLGRLNLDELSERIEETYSAKMLSELSAPTGPMRELPPLSPPLRPPTASYPGSPPAYYPQAAPWATRRQPRIGALSQLVSNTCLMILAVGVPLFLLLAAGFAFAGPGGGARIAPIIWLVAIAFAISHFARRGRRSPRGRQRGGPPFWF
jgi:hypothetical protein